MNVRSQTTQNLDDQGRWVNGVSEPWWFSDSIAKSDIVGAEARWAAIGSHQNEELAGDYFIGGDTHGKYLRWSPQKGFVLFHVDKCAAKVMALSYGRVITSPGLIQLLPEKTVHPASKHGHGSEVPLRFLPVTWRKTKYLVPEDRISDFADYAAGLGSFNQQTLSMIEFAPFLFKVDGASPIAPETGVKGPTLHSASGFIKPVVPPGYGLFIKRPIDGRLTRVDQTYVKNDPENPWWDKLMVPVTINVGSALGLKPKMILHIVDDEGFGEDVIVTRVNRFSARGVVERPVRKMPCVKFAETDDCLNLEYAPITVGSIVTTNPMAEDFAGVAKADLVPSP